MAQIRWALQTRHQISLADLVEHFPLEQGLAELVAYLSLAADDDITSLLHIDDAASAAVQSLTWPTGAVNICDDEPARGRDWVPAFCRAVAAPPPAPVAAASARRGWARGADNAYARTQLGWVPRYPSWRDGFASFAARAG